MLCRRIAIIDRGVIKEDTTMKGFLNQLNEESFICDLPLNLLKICNWISSASNLI